YGFLEKSVPDFYDLVRSQKRNTSDNHLDCCNGLVLLYNPSTYQFCVCNPITKQHASIPTTCLHENEYFCAALAFDPIESNHFRVVRIDYSRQLTSLKSTSTPLDMVMDIFSSQSRQWVRHGLQLDPMFIEGFKTFKLCRHFVYLRGVLYSLTSSGKILCIDLNTIKARAFDLPHGPEDDDADDNKMGATTMGMGCLGISRGLVCYVKRDSSKTFQFWSYDDRQCTSGSGGDQWTLRHSVLDEYLKGPVKPYAISPNSHVVFYGTLNMIGSYNFENRRVELLGKGKLTIASPGYHSPFFTLRPCLIPFYCLGERNACSTPIIPEGVAKGVEILSAEVACQCDEQKHREFEWVIINNSCSIENKSPFVFPSEMQLCAEMEEMQQPKTHPQDA
ncbi:F-box family protein, partial [Prunus dulcis]